MATTPKTITLTEKTEAMVNMRVASGEYGNASEYIRDLIRRDDARRSGEAKLAELLREGLESGISDRSILDILEDTKAEMKADGRI